MKVLLTGGGGYVGSILTSHLLSLGHQVTVLDRFYFGRNTLAKHRRDRGFKSISADIRDCDLSFLSKGHYEAVLHLAALSNDPSCDLRPELTFDVNVEGTRRLAEAAKAAGIRRFVMSSSCSVYGSGEGQILTEESSKNPVSTYAESKIRGEKVLSRLEDGSFRPTILRLSTVFGLSPRMRFDLAINLMTLNGVLKKKIFIMGGGKQWRPFLHVRDAAAVFAQVLEEPLSKVGGQAFNIGADEANYQIADLAKTVAAELGDVELEWAPDDADKRTYRVSFEKARRILGLKLKHDARYGIREIAGAIRDGTIREPEGDSYYNIRTMKKIVVMPAKEGGEPIRKGFLPFALPLLGKEEEDEVIDSLRSGWITTGPKTKRFEERFASLVGAKHCLAVDSCTSALHLALKVLDIGPGDEVITSPITFVATANVIEHVGAKPVFVDVDPSTLNMDVGKLVRAISKRTKAVIPVHLSGYPCDLREIHAIARKRGLKVIEDAAHAAGSSYRGKPIGAWSDFTCFSFYPIKNFTAIEGGAITTPHDRYIDRLRRLSLHGMDRDAWKRYSAAGSPHWQVTEPGFKYNMTDVQAAVGLHQLDRLEGFGRRRNAIVRAYDEAFKDLPGLVRPRYDAKDRVGNHHLYIIILETSRLRIDRDEMLDALKREGIGNGLHFIPVHFHPFYRDKYHLKDKDLPVASDLGRRILSLPLYPKMSDEDVQDVITAVQKLHEYYAIDGSGHGKH